MPSKRALIVFLLCLFVLGVRPGYAHPMGNFSVNHYSKISIEGDGIRVQYIIDLAEIPTYQELQQGNITAEPDAPGVARYLLSRGEELGRGLSLTVDGKSLPLHLLSKDILFPPGAGGLPTMKMGFVFRASYPQGSGNAASTLLYTDHNFAGHAGWKEIIVAAPASTLLASSVPQKDRSAELSNYPTDLLSSPPQDLSATLRFTLPATPHNGRTERETRLQALQSNVATQTSSVRRSSTPVHSSLRSHAVAHAADVHPEKGSAPHTKTLPPAVPTAKNTGATAAVMEPMHLRANQQATPRDAFTELITAGHLSAWFFFTAALIAFGLGALHALEPGHGKTIVAAYLVGSRGTARHAALLGIVVTASHTAGVFALGAITLYASRYIVPEQLYPWLGVLSGLIIAALGGYMFLRRWSGESTDHAHAAGQMHGHWFSSKTKLDDDRAAELARASALENAQLANASTSVSLTQLLTLGITGGIIPCPAALVVLLSALALHRIGLGFFLIIIFSFGLAAVLIGFGMLMVYARRFMVRFQLDGPLTKRWLPVASAGCMTILGAAIALHAFATTGLNPHLFSQRNLGPVLFVAGLGLVLGMRHSTDPDHVVAVSTIISKQRSIRHAALIGSLWGLGHTLTIFAVGSLIILFGVVIPPRIGLSMEFSVALMLILLGMLNLTGIMQKITSRFTSRNRSPEETPACATFKEPPGASPGTLLERTVGRFGVYQCVRPLAIGIVHGLAGSAAVALLVLSTIHSPLWATAYLLIFGVGTMVGMMLMTATMALPLAYAGNHFTRVSRYLGLASGLVSVCFGVFLVYQLGYVGGLFTSHPQWTPH
jgi:high-affinity nickel-transport protein